MKPSTLHTLALRGMAACLALAMLPAPAMACTLWASAGPAASGGTLLSKNRDWATGQHQALKMVFPKQGIPYFGLYAVDGKSTGIRNGINEMGLSAVTASASSIAHAERGSQPGKHGVLRQILSRYGSVDDLAAHADQVFSQARASFLMVSDRKKILVAEIGLQGHYSYKVMDAGTTAHTNYYLDPSLSQFNTKIGSSSATRYQRVTQLLDQSAQPLTVARYEQISSDHHDGPNRSLWRTGSKESTLASWIVQSPAVGPQTLRVVLTHTGTPDTIQTFTLDRNFWNKSQAAEISAKSS